MDLLQQGRRIERRADPDEILHVQELLGATAEQMQEALAMTASTYKRRFSKSERLTLQETESLFRIRDRLDLSVEVFGEEEGCTWFTEPHVHLDDKTPLAACRTEPGGRAVENILLAIEYGNLA